MIADQTVGEEGKGGRSDKPKPPISVDADTAATVGMIHKSELALVGMSLFQRWKLSNFGTERFFLGDRIGDEYENDEV